MDPHKSSATIEIIDDRERILDQGRFGTDPDGYQAMLCVDRRHPERTWACTLPLFEADTLTCRSVHTMVTSRSQGLKRKWPGHPTHADHDQRTQSLSHRGDELT
jgi:hypothetical protein